MSAAIKLPGADAGMIVRFVPFVLAELAPHVVPIAFLFAVVATYARLAGSNEWTALQMSGLSPFRLIAPALALAGVLAVATGWAFSDGLPYACRQQKTFQVRALKELFTRLSPGRTELQLGTFHLAARARAGDEFVDAVLQLPATDQSPGRTLFAERVRFESTADEVLVHLASVRTVSGEDQAAAGQMMLRFRWTDFVPAQDDLDLGAVRYQSSQSLRLRLEAGHLARDSARKIEFELHERRANSVTSFVFVLVGVASGLRIGRRAPRLALVIALGCGVIYYVTSMRLGRFLSTSGAISPLWSAWATNLVATALGAWLLPRSWDR